MYVYFVLLLTGNPKDFEVQITNHKSGGNGEFSGGYVV